MTGITGLNIGNESDKVSSLQVWKCALTNFELPEITGLYTET